MKPASSTPRLTPAAPKHGALAYHASPTHYSRPAAATPGAPPSICRSSPSKVEGVAAGPGACALRRRCPHTGCRGKRASKMHKLTKPQVSAHYCAKPGENARNANVPRRGTTFHLASRRGRAAPGVLIVPLRGTIGGNGIINPTFDACGAETWGFGISCVSDALLTPCRRDTRRPTIHLPQLPL